MSSCVGTNAPPVHPRRRGEHPTTSASPASTAGSSPQARGTHLREFPRAISPRFIPAGAGNTLYPISPAQLLTVHPRRRGEHLRLCGRLCGRIGSSPQARGTLSAHPAGADCQRFIPAGAGNTSRELSGSNLQTVHPRRRGEHTMPPEPALNVDGSSPQARGTPELPPALPPEVRFIPAGAGNTLSSCVGTNAPPVHPRRRGEHPSPGTRKSKDGGSSPQARGTLTQMSYPTARDRFIPAGAGNTWIARADLFWTMVHPRRRGEH